MKVFQKILYQPTVQHLHMFRSKSHFVRQFSLCMIQEIKTDIQIIKPRRRFPDCLIILSDNRKKRHPPDFRFAVLKYFSPCVIVPYVFQILSDCLFTDHYVILLVIFINKKCLDGRLLSQSRIRQGIYLLHESYLRWQMVQIDHGRCFSPTVSCSRGDYSILSNKFDKRCFVSFPDNHQCVTIQAFHGKTSVRLLLGCHIIETVMAPNTHILTSKKRS